MKLVMVGFMLAVLAATTPVQAQDASKEASRDQDGPLASSIADSAKRATLHLELQPTTQAGGGKALWWTGWAMAASGGVLAALSQTALREHDFTGEPGITAMDCFGDYTSPYCSQFVTSNRGVLWLGVGLAGTGVTMAILGKARQRSTMTFMPTTGGIALFRHVTF